MFVDEVRLFVAGGRGGNGAATFHREKYRPKGGPDGGDGGGGGSIILEADQGTGSLKYLKDHPHQRAKAGKPGAGNNRTGAEAEDLVVRVPLGTIVRDESQTVIADLANSGARFVAARGGRGGKGNASLVTSGRRTPTFAELGEPPDENWLHLEVRLIADVAVIGYPNAGKSTLVGAVSGAAPKVADYPFTTLDPSLGVVEVDQERFTICDVPGLIEGAHSGKGLGTKFLRHAQRAQVLLHLIDLSSDVGPIDAYNVVRQELLEFNEELAARPELVVLNKIDAVADSSVSEAAKLFQRIGIEPVRISALRSLGLEDLKGRLKSMVDRAQEKRKEEGFELFRTPSDRLSVASEDGAWRVMGAKAERVVAMMDLSNDEAVAYLQERLERVGVEKALEEAGAKHGDEVRIGKAVFEWWPAGSAPEEAEPRSRRRRR